MGVNATDIDEIELFSIEAYAPKFCGCHAAVVMKGKAAKKDPRFERIVLKRVRTRGNEVTFRIKVEKGKR